MSEKYVDPVVTGVHEVRAAMLESAGGEIAELMRRVAEHQQHSHRRIIREPLRQHTKPADARDAAALRTTTESNSPPA
jgi:hypothetical protein